MQSILVSLLSLVALFLQLGPVTASREALSQYVATDGVVYADDASIKAAFDGARDYTMLMLMTSESERIDCQFCRILGPDFRTVASSYDAQLKNSAASERDLFFVIAEPDSMLSLFKDLGLSHVPNVIIYSPTKSKSEAKQGYKGPHSFMSFMSTGDQKQYLVNQLARMGFHITLQKPFPLAKMLKTLATVVAAGVGLLFFRSYALTVWQSKQIWLALSLMSVIMFISGHMFNVTRGTPFMSFDGQNLRMFEPGFSGQVAAETQVMAVVYAVLAFTTIGLIKFVPKLTTVKAQSVGAVLGAAVVYVVYSAMLDIFKIKMGDFILWLLPFKIV